jgi:hypothetical protein
VKVFTSFTGKKRIDKRISFLPWRTKMKTLKQLKEMTREKRMMYWAKHSREPLFGVAPEGRSLLEKIDAWGHRADRALFSSIGWLWKKGEELLKLCLPGLIAAFILWMIYVALTTG